MGLIKIPKAVVKVLDYINDYDQDLDQFEEELQKINHNKQAGAVKFNQLFKKKESAQDSSITGKGLLNDESTKQKLSDESDSEDESVEKKVKKPKRAEQA